MALDLNMTGGVKPPKKTPTTPDPFEAMGGGFATDEGGWVPKDHPLAQQQSSVTPVPPPPAAAATPAAPSAPAPAAPANNDAIADVFHESLVNQMSNPDPFTASGGGVQVNGGWVPKDHPLAQQAEALGDTGGIKPEPEAAPVSSDPFTAMGGGQLINGGWVPNSNPASGVPQNPDPFAEIGGGVQIDGGWVPNSNPAAHQAQTPTPEVSAATPVPALAAVTPTPLDPVAPPVTQAPVTPVPTAAPPEGDPINDTFRAAVMKMLTAQATPGDVQNDPRAAAYRNAQRRNQDRARAQAAETANSDGTIGSGGFDGEMRGMDQQRGEAEAQFEAGLVGEQMKERRADLMYAMSVAQQLGDREYAADLQRELAQLDAQIRREGNAITTRGQDLDASLQREGYGVTTRGQDIDAALQKEGYGVTKRGQDVQKFGINTSAELDRAQQQLQRYGLDLNDKRTAERLGFDYAQLQELANRQAVLAALG